MRHVADQRVIEVHRVIGAGAADMHVLAEHRELLGEEAVLLGDGQEALGRVDAPLAPLLERVRPAAGDGDVHLPRMARQHVARGAQLGEEIGKAGVHARIDLDHALRELGLELAAVLRVGGAAQQIVRIGREVPVARVDEHQLQLDAEGQCVRGLELEHRPRRRPQLRAAGSPSPARSSA
jgi:hypothetical protein